MALPGPSCEAAEGGSVNVAPPELMMDLTDRYHESWQGSPAVVDLDGDGTVEIAVARHGRLNVWHADGSMAFQTQTEGRIWASPVVVDLVPERAGLEIAVAARGAVYAWDAKGEELDGFPVEWRDELRSLAAGDIDGDGAFELISATTSRLESGGQRDVIIAINGDGSFVDGFPPNTTGASGCDDFCYPTGSFDQNIAVGDLDGNDVPDIFVPHDNAYVSVHDGTGRAFDAADIDGDGQGELVVVGSVQNASQDDRKRGVVLFVVNPDGTRPEGWVQPYYVPGYLAGLDDFDGTNVVGMNNQVSVVDLEPGREGPEIVFADYDGRIHCVDARGQVVWTYRYTDDAEVLTGGVVIADLSRDGVPELAFASYSPDQDKGELFVLDAGGNELHRVSLPGRGAMAVPSIADVDDDGQLEIVVSLKGNDEDGDIQGQIYTVPGSADNCMPWPTGRGNLRRDGTLPKAD